MNYQTMKKYGINYQEIIQLVYKIELWFKCTLYLSIKLFILFHV